MSGSWEMEGLADGAEASSGNAAPLLVRPDLGQGLVALLLRVTLSPLRLSFRHVVIKTRISSTSTDWRKGQSGHGWTDQLTGAA